MHTSKERWRGNQKEGALSVLQCFHQLPNLQFSIPSKPKAKEPKKRVFVCPKIAPPAQSRSKSPFKCVFWSIYISFFELNCAASFYHWVGCSQESLFVFLAVARSVLTWIGCSQPFLPEILGCSRVPFSAFFTSFFFYPSTSSLLQMQLKCGPLPKLQSLLQSLQNPKP